MFILQMEIRYGVINPSSYWNSFTINLSLYLLLQSASSFTMNTYLFYSALFFDGNLTRDQVLFFSNKYNYSSISFFHYMEIFILKDSE